MKISDFKKYCLTLVVGLLAATAGHAYEFSECLITESSTEEVEADSQGLPFHYEQIQLLSLQQAFQQSHEIISASLLTGGGFEVWVRRHEEHALSFLQDIRWVLETLLFPFHSFW